MLCGMTLVREHDPFSGHREPVSLGDAIAETFPDGVPPTFPAEYTNTPAVAEPPAGEAPLAKPVRARRARRAKATPAKPR